MNSRKLLPAAIAAGAAATALALPAAASASIASTPAAASSSATDITAQANGKFHINLSITQKKESSRSYKASRTGTIKLRITKKRYDNRVDLRIVKCGSRVALTDFQQVKKLPGGRFYTLKDNGRPKTIRKGTCFQVQAKRSTARWVKGDLRY